MSEERKKILDKINSLIEEKTKELLQRIDSGEKPDKETEYERMKMFENIEYFAVIE